MQKGTCYRLLNERLNKIQEISKKYDYNNLTYYFIDSRISLINFIKFKGPFGFFEEIKNGKYINKKSGRRTKTIKSNLGEITSGNPRHKEKYQLDTIKNAKNLYDSRQRIIKFNDSEIFNDSAKIIVILPIMIINKTQGSYTLLFQINRLVVY